MLKAALRKPAVLILTLLLLPAWSYAANIKRFVVMVPVYSELYSENIALLLQSLYTQDLSGMDFDKIDVVLGVNNTRSASATVKTENTETVAYLNELKAGRVPQVSHAHPLLARIARLPINNKINLRVLDWTHPGYSERNIGQVRNDIFNKSYEQIPYNERSNTVMALMDGDTRVPADYVKNVVAAYQSGDVKFVYLKLTYTDQPGSDLRVYQRKITTDFRAASWQYNLASDNDLPRGGGPRITVRADVLANLGGIPKRKVGEDTILGDNLKSRYRSGGRWIPFPVMANYRAREGSYDGAIYLEELNKPITFTPYDYGGVTKLNEDIEYWKKKKPLVYAFYLEARERNLSEYRQSVKLLRSQIVKMIQDKRYNHASSGELPALLANPWFSDLLGDLIRRFRGNENEILRSLTETLPYYLSPEPLEASRNVINLGAGVDAWLVSRQLDLGTAATVLKSFQSTHPKFYAMLTSNAARLVTVGDQINWADVRAVRDNLVEKWKKNVETIRARTTPDNRGQFQCKGCKDYHLSKPDFRDIDFDFKAFDTVLKMMRADINAVVDADQKAVLMPLYFILDEAEQRGFRIDNRLKQLRKYLNSDVQNASVVDWTKARILRDNLAKEWQEALNELKTQATPSNGRYRCNRCRDYHQSSPDLRGISFKLESFYRLLAVMQTGLNGLAGPDERAILMPLFKILEEAVEIGGQGLLKRVPGLEDQLKKFGRHLNIVDPPIAGKCEIIYG